MVSTSSSSSPSISSRSYRNSGVTNTFPCPLVISSRFFSLDMYATLPGCGRLFGKCNAWSDSFQITPCGLSPGVKTQETFLFSPLIIIYTSITAQFLLDTIAFPQHECIMLPNSCLDQFYGLLACSLHACPGMIRIICI